MEQNNKVLLLAAMIVLVAIVSFQFGGVTGQVVDDDDGIEVEVLEDSVVFQSGQYGVKDSKLLDKISPVDKGKWLPVRRAIESLAEDSENSELAKTKLEEIIEKAKEPTDPKIGFAV